VWLLRACFATRAGLVAENLALRQQLNVLRRSVKRPKLRFVDRVFWVWFAALVRDWQSLLVIVEPATVVRWHREGFRLYWRWKSRGRKPGRPKLSAEIRELIRRMATENVTWGAPRIQSELALLGHVVAESTVSAYLRSIRDRRPPSQRWTTFLRNHAKSIAAADLFVVPTIRFQLLYVLVVLRHDRRTVAHFNVTEHPTSRWVAQQIVEAFPNDEAPRFLIHDRDAIFGVEFNRRVASMGIEQVRTAYRSPWQNGICERLIGSIRRECLDHVVVFSEAHLRRILREYFAYYHDVRTHLALGRNAPIPRAVEPPENGRILATPYLGGLHHRYSRAA